MKEKELRRFIIKIFDEHGRFVEDFALCADTKRSIKKMVEERMRINKINKNYTFTISS